MPPFTRRFGACALLSLLPHLARGGDVLDVRKFGGVLSHTEPGKSILQANAASVSKALKSAKPGDTVLLPAHDSRVFFSTGGIEGSNLENITFRLEGTLQAAGGWDIWPLSGGDFAPMVLITNSTGFRMTGGGTVNGAGKVWWDRYVLKPLKGKRPKLILIENATDMIATDLHLVNSPSFHFQFVDCVRVEIANVNVTVDRKMPLFDPALQPEDLNTDGFDISGRDFWIHDCSIRNDDDSIAIKPCGPKRCVNSKCTENVLIENMRLVGFGASIGSVPPIEVLPGEAFGQCVRNITFRNIDMPGTGKGVYVKSNPSCAADGSKTAIIQDILYQDIKIDRPLWWAIWIGPQQQHEPGSDLGEKCALTYPIHNHCPTQSCVEFKNITLRRITVTDPLLSPGVLLGNESSRLDVTFDDVVFKYTNPIGGRFPFGRHLKCSYADLKVAKASSGTPSCGEQLQVVV
eukprot:TRINITY_DN28433_c0_g2_i1.p1 TRINITY_DN28433_c0_g2~~TRINITY_DN28433_c0_g2_i1.p1  ORF type:complete len:461 (-),score=52.83 TRINITY_DN28433_c0_g2_i1:135-1517(-)